MANRGAEQHRDEWWLNRRPGGGRRRWSGAGGAQRSYVCVRLLVRPLASPHRDRLPQKQQQRQRQGRPRALLIYLPTPEMTSLGPPLPLPPPLGVQLQVDPPPPRSHLLASGPRLSRLMGQVARSAPGSQRVAQGSQLTLHPFTAPPTGFVSVGKSLSFSGPRVPARCAEVPASPSASLHAPEAPL